MATACCVPGCRTGKKPNKKFPEKVKLPTFSFPTEPDLRQLWIEAIPKEGFKLSKQSRVCLAHFLPEHIKRNGFHEVSADSKYTVGFCRKLCHVNFLQVCITICDYWLHKYLTLHSITLYLFRLFRRCWARTFYTETFCSNLSCCYKIKGSSKRQARGGQLCE